MVSGVPAARSRLHGGVGWSGSREDHASKLSYPVKSTLAASDAKADQFAAIVIPGGFSRTISAGSKRC